MPEETTAIDYVMEAASGPHFSGLRLDSLRSAAPSLSSPRASAPLTPPSSAFTPADSSAAAQKQPFVIGTSIFFNLRGGVGEVVFEFCFFECCCLIFALGAGVSGGTASGKTTVCDMIIQQLHDHRVVLVNQVCA